MRRNLRSLLAEAESRLSDSAHPQRAKLDAEALLLHVLQRKQPECNRAWLITHANSVAPSEIAEQFQTLIARRFRGEPIQYIVGETEFYSLPFHVTPDVLIPRPETEHLVELAIALAGDLAEPRIVDVGAGSGAIAVSLAYHLSDPQITSIDISEKALAVARGNAKQNNVAGRIRFLHGDLLAPVAGERFDMVVSNPPYVREGERAALDVEVREYEPALALFAGQNGLDIYRRLIPQARAALATGGVLLMEIGHGQSEAILELFVANGFAQSQFLPDLQGIPRVACARRS